MSASKISEIANVLEMDKEKLLQSSVAHFLDEEMSSSEKRIGKLYIEDSLLCKKYGMDLDALCKAIQSLEMRDRYEEKDINGISVLEAASDSRCWEHIKENLKKEEIKHDKLVQLKELWKKSGVSAL